MNSPNFTWQVTTCSCTAASDIFNMFALYMFGGQLERLWGPQRFELLHHLRRAAFLAGHSYKD